MAQGIKALSAKADNLRSILGSNVVEKEPTSLLSFDHNTWGMTHAHKIKWVGTAEITQQLGVLPALPKVLSTVLNNPMVLSPGLQAYLQVESCIHNKSINQSNQSFFFKVSKKESWSPETQGYALSYKRCRVATWSLVSAAECGVCIGRVSCGHRASSPLKCVNTNSALWFSWCGLRSGILPNAYLVITIFSFNVLCKTYW